MAATLPTDNSSTYNQGQTNVGNAANQGQNAINSFNPSNYAANETSGFSGLNGSQNSTQSNYINAFQNQISSQPSTTQAYQTGQKIYNVQPLQNTANQLNNAVLQAPINDVNAAKGFNYDNNQVGQKQTQDLTYLTPQANAAQNNAATAQQNATNYANLQYEQNQMNILPAQQQGQYLMQQYASQMSNYTAANAAQLSALQDKMNQGVSLSNQEMQSYATLTQAEQQYQGYLAQANAQVNAAQATSQYHVVSPSQGLFDAQTGITTPYQPNAQTPANAVSY